MSDFTAEQIIEHAQFVSVNTVPVLDELLRLLKDNIPVGVDAYNTKFSLSGNKKVEIPKSYRIAPDDITNISLQEIHVDLVEDLESAGTGLFIGDATLAIYVINERNMMRESVRTTFGLIKVIQGILHLTLGGWPNFWYLMRPLAVQSLPSEYEGYAGKTLMYKMKMNPQTW